MLNGVLFFVGKRQVRQMAESVGEIGLDLVVNQNSFNRQMRGITSLAKKAGAAIAGAFGVKKLIEFGKSCLDLGSGLVEVQNVVDVTFPAMTAQVDKFAQSAVENFGLSETMAKQYTGTFGAMAKAFGFSEKQAYAVGTSLTALAGDVASFYNLSQDEAYTKLKSVFTGETESLKDLGIVMTQTALDEKFLEQLNSLATNAMGYYETQEKQNDGSTIMYMHDKPDLKDSTVVYKKTIDGFFWSKDGGRTWTSGIDKDGNAVLNVIAATGIRGDWIDADSITAKQLSVDYKKAVTKEIEDADGQLKEWSTSYIAQTISTAEDKITLKNSREIAALMHCYTKNGEFSDTLDRWKNSDTTAISLVEHETLGKCAKFSGTSTSAYLQQYWSDMQAGTYKLRFKAATDVGYENRARVKCSFNSMQRFTDAGALKSDEWTQFEFEFEATATGKKYLYLYDYVSGIPIYLKDVELLGKYEIYNEAQIVLLDNKISLKVTKDEVNSLIEQSAESIRLKASKISWQSTYSSMSESGVLKCTNAELKGTLKAGSDTGYWVQLASTGKLTGGYGNNQYGYIDYSATAKNLNTGAVHKGLQIQGGCLRISVNELATRSSSNVSDTAYIGGTGTISYISKIVDNGDGTITWRTSDLTFENGLMVTDI